MLGVGTEASMIGFFGKVRIYAADHLEAHGEPSHPPGCAGGARGVGALPLPLTQVDGSVDREFESIQSSILPEPLSP